MNAWRGVDGHARLDIGARRSIDGFAVEEPVENAMTTLTYRVYLAGFVVLLLLGCGPITAHQALKKAQTAIDQAKGSQADEKAPYEYFSAIQHFDKAREEEGYSDYQACIDLAQTALELAELSREKANRPPDPETGPVKPREAVEGPKDGTNRVPSASPRGRQQIPAGRQFRAPSGRE